MATGKKKLPTVELLNVPHYHQGAFDGLCSYYTGAMMLTTLYPDYSGILGKTRRKRTTKYMSDDPLISNYGSKETDTRIVLARWFYHGEYLTKVVAILNRLLSKDRKKTRFRCEHKGAWDNTFYKIIAESIDKGLPVMLGWSTPDYSDHAVLVTGYWEGRERWLLINDPGDDKHQISWDSLKYQNTSKFEIGLCRPETHSGYRPMKRVSEKQRDTVYSWNDNDYEEIDFS